MGVCTACSAKWYLGGLTFRTRYVTFRPRETYTLTFTCRPRPLARLIEPVALAAFRSETARRLRALATYLHSAGDRPAG